MSSRKRPYLQGPWFSAIILPALLPTSAIAGEGAIQAGEAYFRVIWGLLVVLGIMLVVYGFVRKRFSLLNGPPSKAIQVLEVRPLMGRKALCLVRVKGNEYLLGLSGDRIDCLATLSGKDVPDFEKTLNATRSGEPS